MLVNYCKITIKYRIKLRGKNVGTVLHRTLGISLVCPQFHKFVLVGIYRLVCSYWPNQF